MEMFLTALVLSVLGVAVSAIAFAAATREPEALPESAPAVRVPASPPMDGFFMDPAWTTPQVQVPIEALLLQIERHVRLEHAAAEAFQQAPTPELLHIRTASPLVH
jgi:hypothetical protein